MAPSDANPMRTFDPSKPCMVHDGLNDDWFEWHPEREEARFRQQAERHSRDDPDVIAYQGLLLDGWKAKG
jgi:hypothetical protein